MTAVGIVCGYDLNADLIGYVDSIRPLIDREKLDYLVLSGGRTSPDSFSSEAWVMARALGDVVPAERILLEEHAMTTLENLVFARGLAEHHCGVVQRFIVFCDRVHRRKVSTLARMILGARPVVYCVDRPVPLRVLLFEPLSHLIEAMVAVIPPLRRYLRATAVRIKGVSGTPPRSAQPAIASDAATPGLPTRRYGTADRLHRPERSREA